MVSRSVRASDRHALISFSCSNSQCNAKNEYRKSKYSKRFMIQFMYTWCAIALYWKQIEQKTEKKTMLKLNLELNIYCPNDKSLERVSFDLMLKTISKERMKIIAWNFSHIHVDKIHRDLQIYLMLSLDTKMISICAFLLWLNLIFICRILSDERNLC